MNENNINYLDDNMYLENIDDRSDFSNSETSSKRESANIDHFSTTSPI